MSTSHDLRAARARFAYDEAAGWKKDVRKPTTQRVKGLPVQMRTQGLMQTLAVLMADDREYVRHLAEVTGKWLLFEAPYRALQEAGSAQPHWGYARRLLESCMKASRLEYAWAQLEAIQLLDQIKIYADALSKEGG